MGDNKRVVKFKKRRSINIGIVIFVILFLYIAIYVYIYLTKEQMSIYAVQEGSNVEDNLVTGLILREEEVVSSGKAGYVSYFQKEGARLARNAPVYSVDESRDILDVIISGDEPFAFTKESNAQFRYKINEFQNSYNDNDFTLVYRFKEEAQSTVLDLLNLAMIEKGQQVEEETGFAYSYEVVHSTVSGIITYYLDSYEEVTAEDITRDLFQPETYERISLRTTEMIEPNTPVYKIIKSEDWSILVPLTEDQYVKLAGKDKISFTIQKDDFDVEAGLTLLPDGNGYFAELTMDKHMSKYLSDRYLEIMLHLDAARGLKIPLSSIVEKDFYIVPMELFTVGADSGEKGLIKQTFSENGEVVFTFIPADIYYQEDGYGYVDTRIFAPDTLIKWPDSTDTYQLSRTGKLTGVFNVNMGFAVFKRIEVIYQNEAYCIVKKDTSYGLSLYDHIALDASTAVEQAIIY